jgi:hypothetical protein
MVCLIIKGFSLHVAIRLATYWVTAMLNTLQWPTLAERRL